MKTRHQNCRKGLTLIEVLFVVTALVFIAFIILPRFRRASNSSLNITCINNLKQVGLSFRIYAGDNAEKFPMNIGTTNNPVVNEATPVYQYLQILSNELGTTKVVNCPRDLKRKPAKDFTNFNNKHVSYFIGLDSHESLPETMLAGDRNITNGFVPKDGLLAIATNQMVGFTDEIHLKQGNIAIGDGSVQQVTSARLHSEIIPKTGMATNRIKLP